MRWLTPHHIEYLHLFFDPIQKLLLMNFLASIQYYVAHSILAAQSHSGFVCLENPITTCKGEVSIVFKIQ